MNVNLRQGQFSSIFGVESPVTVIDSFLPHQHEHAGPPFQRGQLRIEDQKSVVNIDAHSSSPAIGSERKTLCAENDDRKK